MDSSTVSIVVPVYNAGAYLDKCIDSIVSQSYKDIEVLLIDDGSVDGSGGVCDGWALADERVKVFHRQNSGVSSARNYGIEQASGRYLMFVDADDWIEGDAVESALRRIVSEPQTKVCLFDLRIESSDQKNDRVQRLGLGNQTVDSWNLLERYVSLGDRNIMGSVWSAIIDLEYLKESGIRFDESVVLWEDLLFMVELLEETEVVGCLDRILYHYRVNPDSALNGKRYKSGVVHSAMTLIEQLAPIGEHFPDEYGSFCASVLSTCIANEAYRTAPFLEKVTSISSLWSWAYAALGTNKALLPSTLRLFFAFPSQRWSKVFAVAYLAYASMPRRRS